MARKGVYAFGVEGSGKQGWESQETEETKAYVMQYVGGKAKIGREIVCAICEDTWYRSHWFEPFVGGASVTEYALMVPFQTYTCHDAHEDLVLMWQAIKEGWEPPSLVTRKQYELARSTASNAVRGFIGFGASFGGKWFGGYGSHDGTDGNTVTRSSHNSVMRKAQLIKRSDITFRQVEFSQYDPPAKSVVYCDPPYSGTQGYAKSLEAPQYWYYRVLERWARDLSCAVYTSEYEIPADVPHKLIWSKVKRKTLALKSDKLYSTENLYRILPS